MLTYNLAKSMGISSTQEFNDFWEQIQQDLGEQVLTRALGACVDGCRNSSRKHPLWGLLFLTERALYFRHFAHKNSLSSLLIDTRLLPAAEEVYFSIAIEHIRNVSLERNPSLLKRLFSSTPPVLTVDYLTLDTHPHTLRFFLESDPDRFLALLEERRHQSS